MGRTYRRRKKRKALPVLTSNDSEKVVKNLAAWLDQSAESGGLKVSNFPDTGRGLMATKHIEPGQTIVKIPVKNMVTRGSALLSTKAPNSWPTQLILTDFLLCEAAKGRDSPWHVYFQTLPTSYDVPFFELSQPSAIKALPAYLRDVVMKQRKVVVDAFRCLVKSRPEMRSKFGDFSWAWFTVNTRAVYFADGHDNLALAPFLDMFNHSSRVGVETGVKNASLYEISTRNSFRPGDQVFINYGPHANLTLYAEYGFVVQENPHDVVPLSLYEIFAPEKSARIFEFAKKWRLDENLCVVGAVDEPVSWNVLACLSLMKNLGNCTKFALFSNDENVADYKELLEPVIKAKKVEIESAMSAISAPGAIRLLKIHREIVDRALLMLHS